MPRKNFSIGLDEIEADILEAETEKQNISYSKYVSELLLVNKKTPRQRILSLLEMLSKNMITDEQNKKLFDDTVEAIKFNLNKV